MEPISQSRVRVKLGIATDDDYIKVIEESLSSTPWFIEDVIGIFIANKGMGMSGQNALLKAIEAFGEAMGVEFNP
jgi:phage tail tape-measure protein